VSDTDRATVFAPLNADTGVPVELAMQRLWLAGRVLGVGARLLVKHAFRSGETKPLEAIYSFVLPRDAALRRFRISGAGFSVASELKPVEEVRETYEDALAAGHTAAMAAEYRDGMVNLTVGNIRPGEEVTVSLEIVAGVETRDDGIRFRFPFALAPAYHARARMAAVAPGAGEIELPDAEFGDLVLPQFVSDASALHEVGFDLSVSMGQPIVEIGSPSHPIKVAGQGLGRSRVSLATAGDLPDRDLVLDVRTGESLAGIVGGKAADGRGYFGAVIPSAAFKPEGEGEAEEPRRVVFVLDRSGSMEGAALDQARRAIGACLGALDAGDSFGLVAFDNTPHVFKKGLVRAWTEDREAARKFLAGIQARGGTELALAIQAAADMLKAEGAARSVGGDVLVVTDGQVMGTEAILETARECGLRLHCLGIGSASQDRFLTLLARETGGVSRFLTPRERVDLGAVELFASIGRPLGRGLSARIEGWRDGRIAPDLPAHVFGGTPVVAFGDTDGGGEGRLVLEWDAAGKRRTAAAPIVVGEGPGGDGETLRLLQGARLITDMEGRYERGEPGGAARDREAERVRKRLRALSQAYGLASREMGLVAVVERAGDRPGDIPVTRVVPVGLAQDVRMAAYFAGRKMPMPALIVGDVDLALGAPDTVFQRRSVPALRRSRKEETLLLEYDPAGSSVPGGAEDPLFSLAARLEPDGGMPGGSEEERAIATVHALLLFLSGGHSARRGAFRAHVKRMLEFLRKAAVRKGLVDRIVDRALSGRAVPGEWSKEIPGPDLWAKIEAALD